MSCKKHKTLFNVLIHFVLLEIKHIWPVVNNHVELLVLLRNKSTYFIMSYSHYFQIWWASGRTSPRFPTEQSWKAPAPPARPPAPPERMTGSCQGAGNAGQRSA